MDRSLVKIGIMAKGVPSDVADVYLREIFDKNGEKRLLQFGEAGKEYGGVQSQSQSATFKAQWDQIEKLVKENPTVATAAAKKFMEDPDGYTYMIRDLASNMAADSKFGDVVVKNIKEKPQLTGNILTAYQNAYKAHTLPTYIAAEKGEKAPTVAPGGVSTSAGTTHTPAQGQPGKPTEKKQGKPAASASVPVQSEAEKILAQAMQQNPPFAKAIRDNGLQKVIVAAIEEKPERADNLFSPGAIKGYMAVIEQRKGATPDVIQTAFMNAFSPKEEIPSLDMAGLLHKAFGEGGEGLKDLLGNMEGLTKGLPPELGNMLSGVFREVESIFNGVGQLAMAYQKGADRQKALLASMDPKAGVAYAASHAGITKADPVYQAETAMANVELANSNNPQLARQGTNYLMSLGCSPDQIELLKEGKAGIAAVDVSRDTKTGKVSFKPTFVDGPEWKIIDNIRTANQRAKQEETGKTFAEANTSLEQRKKPADPAPALAPAETAAT